MRKITGLLTAICISVAAGGCLSSCGFTECSHDYELIVDVAATCTDEGRQIYKCSKCGDSYALTQAAKGHVAGEAATETTTQNCTVCGVVLEDEKNDYTSVKSTARGLSVNYLNTDGSEEYFRTRIDTQSHGKYSLPEYTCYSDLNGENQLAFKASVPVQEFFTHDILSVYGLGTNDGKTFLTQSGFKVNFEIKTFDAELQKLSAYKYLAEEFSNPEDLRIVRAYPAPANFGSIYEIVDFSGSYLEVAKLTETGYTAVCQTTLDSLYDGLPDVELSDNGKLFMECGTYRVLFKYTMAWAATPSAVYDAEGIAVVPYGIIADQYDYFYVTIGTEKANVLLPSAITEEAVGGDIEEDTDDIFDSEENEEGADNQTATEPETDAEDTEQPDEEADDGENNDVESGEPEGEPALPEQTPEVFAGNAFYQLRAASAVNQWLFLEPESVIEFGEQIIFNIDTLLDFEDGEYRYNGNRLYEFTMQVYYITDGEEQTSELVQELDLTQLFVTDDCVEAVLELPQELSGGSFKIIVRSSFSEGESGSAESVTSQIYFATLKW